MTQKLMTQRPTGAVALGLLLSGRARDGIEQIGGHKTGEETVAAGWLDGISLDERGRAGLHNFYELRKLSVEANQLLSHWQDASEQPGAVETGRLGAVACLNHVWRSLLETWRAQVNPDGFGQAMRWLEEEMGAEFLQDTLSAFSRAFPGENRRKSTGDDVFSLDADLDGSVQCVADLVTVRLLNENPAVGAERVLFADHTVMSQKFDALMRGLESFFDTQPGLDKAVANPQPRSRESDGSSEQVLLNASLREISLLEVSLLEVLRAPIVRGGDSLYSQLEFLGRHFGHLLPAGLLEQILSTLDVLREESKGRFGGGAPGPVETPSFAGLEELGARFSADAHWMTDLVLLAKNVHVWLAQLSRREGRKIQHLDEIPDADLEALVERGIRGLWLIGVWQRSPASRRIKELSGSPHVVSSAYSIYEYRIADDLGGQAAWDALRRRARALGLRMAADMVPNHMGITSKWIYEHPEWFIRRDDMPYPSYQFNGPNLSDSPNIGIYLEDHYYERSDAAVTFKRQDFSTGDVQYIYHGNDGTSMPWNDTAQLDYLNPEAREAVIQQILEVARNSSVIRFDAAMTLVKKHIQRLWFPERGAGGAIPSRAQYAMSKEDFERVAGPEFWTEVVERVAQEAPDTLLLAEAFWMMEGFFVRSLGMHRVYNSAFMNMLADEDNAGYRRVMKDTLEFDPQILRRYVNFMSNPDEETALAQFGKGDKYFGVCTLMVTLPGLPMIGHGQVEGFSEKYGMDFNKPRLNEDPDAALVARHRREIFPLMRARHLFSGVENFLLYDFYRSDGDADGQVDENVFAYSNRLGDQASLVVFHNCYGDTRGWIRESVGHRETSDSDGSNDSGDDGGPIVQKNLVSGLDICPAAELFVTFREQRSGLEYICHSQELEARGLFVELGAYDCHIFLDFKTVHDTDDQLYRQLNNHLAGGGTPSLTAEIRRRKLRPLHAQMGQILSPDLVRAFAQGRGSQRLVSEHLEELSLEAFGMLEHFATADAVQQDFGREVACDVAVLLEFQKYAALAPALPFGPDQTLHGDRVVWGALLAWALMRPLGGATPSAEAGLRLRSLWDEWSLQFVLHELFSKLDLNDEGAREKIDRAIGLLRFGLARQGWFAAPSTYDLSAAQLLEALLDDSDARQFLGVNRHDEIVWYHGDSLGILLQWVTRFGAMSVALGQARAGEEIVLAVPSGLAESVREILVAAEAADYRVARLLDGLR